MAVPRPVLLALVGLGLLASVYLVTRSGSSESVNRGTTPAVPAPSAPAHPQKAPPNAARAKRPAGTTHAQPKPASSAPAVTGLEARVQAAARALSEGKVVVFFFSKRGPADDVATRGAVHSIRGMPRVRVFSAGLDDVAAYRPMLANVGISEVPSTVIVRPGKKAVLLQGFVDAGTLRQNVADALR